MTSSFIGLLNINFVSANMVPEPSEACHSSVFKMTDPVTLVSKLLFRSTFQLQVTEIHSTSKHYTYKCYL